MITAFKGRQRQCKTTAMVGTAVELVSNWGYSGDEMFGNLTIRVPGYTRLSKVEMREYVKNMVAKGLRHKILLLDEIDGIFPHRFWTKEVQTETLLGLWQDEKLFNWILYTAHLGLAVDKLIRECTQVVVIPECDKENDAVRLHVINGLEMIVYDDVLKPASEVQKLFDSWEPVV